MVTVFLEVFTVLLFEGVTVFLEVNMVLFCVGTLFCCSVLFSVWFTVLGLEIIIKEGGLVS